MLPLREARTAGGGLTDGGASPDASSIGAGVNLGCGLMTEPFRFTGCEMFSGILIPSL